MMTNNYTSMLRAVRWSLGIGLGLVAWTGSANAASTNVISSVTTPGTANIVATFTAPKICLVTTTDLSKTFAYGVANTTTLADGGTIAIRCTASVANYKFTVTNINSANAFTFDDIGTEQTATAVTLKVTSAPSGIASAPLSHGVATAVSTGVGAGLATTHTYWLEFAMPVYVGTGATADFDTQTYNVLTTIT